MENINKKLAYSLWAVSAISAVLTIIKRSLFGFYFNLDMFGIILAVIFQVLLGYMILRDKNDKVTMVSVIVVAVYTFNLGGLVAIIMRLVLRKNNSEKVRNAWFVPAIVYGAMSLITMIRSFYFMRWASFNVLRLVGLYNAMTVSLTYFDFMGLIILVLNVAYYLIFGYWFIKYLKVN